jgi:hypothetical protein
MPSHTITKVTLIQYGLTGTTTYKQVPGLPSNSPELVLPLAFCYNQPERRELVQALLEHIDPQIPRGKTKIGDYFFYVNDYIMADYHLAVIIYGTLGQNACFNCLHCLGRFGHLVKERHLTESASLRCMDTMVANGRIAQPYEELNIKMKQQLKEACPALKSTDAPLSAAEQAQRTATEKTIRQVDIKTMLAC